MKYLKYILSVFILIQLNSFDTYAQSKPYLSVGDRVPAIHYGTWIKGPPFSVFEKDRVYVFEFWATWCGPCIAAMPHLSELAVKYRDQATFVGVNVYEKTGEKPYESSLPLVKKFVNGSGDRMAYGVVTDNNEQAFANNWLKPARVAGIPSTFIIKNNVIQWIGHPTKIDEVLESIVDDSFDLVLFKQRYELESAKTNDQAARIVTVFSEVKRASDEKEFELAYSRIEEGIKEMPFLNLTLKVEKLKILLDNFSEKEALTYVDQLLKESKEFSLMVAMALSAKEGLSEKAYHKAIVLFSEQSAMNSLILDQVAMLYAKIGDFGKAAETMEFAVSKGKEELTNERFKGRVFDYTIEDYQEKLTSYKNKLK